MHAKPLVMSCLLLCVFVVGMQTATAGLIVNLDATQVSSATPTGGQAMLMCFLAPARMK